MIEFPYEDNRKITRNMKDNEKKSTWKDKYDVQKDMLMARQ